MSQQFVSRVVFPPVTLCSSVCYFLDKWILNIWRSLNIAQGSNIRNIFSAILAYASTEHIHQHPGAMLSHCNLVLTFPSLQLKNIIRCDEKYSFKNISKTLIYNFQLLNFYLEIWSYHWLILLLNCKTEL